MSDRLDTLADENPAVSEALIIISGNVRHTAALLEVLVVTKNGTALRTGSSEFMMAYRS